MTSSADGPAVPAPGGSRHLAAASSSPAVTRIMAVAFAIGATCFLVAPFPGYASLVGPTATAVTFFVGSLFFTAGGLSQTILAAGDRRGPGPGRALWWAAVIQLVGTVFFNISTFRALEVAVDSPEYDPLVWRPDAYGSVCFLASGLLVYWAAPRRRLVPVRAGPGWWQPGVNLLGCVLFGIAAIAGYVVPEDGSMVDVAAANLTTAAGAACFLACAIGTLRLLRSGST